MNPPKLIYGTAWKEEATKTLVCHAIKAGFRGIDTANQRKHYFEAAVGEAIAEMIKTKTITREDLFIQTKFTYINGQDHRLPYDRNADLTEQVYQSFKSSLEHLQTEYVDSYILHGPSTSPGLGESDFNVWNAMEALHDEHKVKYLGASNININQLKQLFKKARIKPKFVQNRCFAQLEWDKEIREFCKKYNIIYQGFSLLTANPFIIPRIQHITKKVNKTPAQVVFKFAQQIGMLPLTGTTNIEHMKQDLDLDFELTRDEVEFIEKVGI